MNTTSNVAFASNQSAGIGALKNPPTQVENELGELRCITESNQKLSIELEQRLSGVLLPCPPQDTKSAPEVTLVDFADSIRQVRRTAEQSNSVLRGILERIQL